ncbi:MAG: putative sulfate exporter family transporter [Brumimicrobium sp.]|nr:putative sulfate exporter family transporter [Brumimicrobium sp.]
MILSKKNSIIILYLLLLVAAILGILNSAGALISGFFVTLFFGNYFEAIKTKLIQWSLKIAVVGLGFGMYLEETVKAGKDGFELTVFTIFSILILGYLLTKLLKLDTKLGYLISSGTSICGGSAIAAVSSVIKATAKDISIALGVVFFLNAIALFFFPPIGHFFELSQKQFGLWAAVAIHDTSSVVGAALDYGQEALRIATTVKLARTLWIIPVSLLSMLLFKSKEGKIKFPWFILLFIAAIFINSYFSLPEQLTSSITLVSHKLLIVTLLLIGSTLSVKDIKETGIKPFLLGVMLWIFVSVTSLWIVLKMF